MVDKKVNKIIKILLVLVICIAILTVVYVNLPEDKSIDDTTDNNEGQNPPATIIFTATYADEILSYTLEELENLEEFSGSGRYVKADPLPDTVIIKGPYALTGVRFSTILEQFESLPEKYNITITTSDNYPINPYTDDNATGTVDIYDETGNVTETSGSTMILAYKQDDEYITDEETGPLRVGFVGDDIITLSSLWAKLVVSIEIIEV